MVHDFLPNWMIFLYWYNAGPLWESALTFQQGRTNFDVKNTCIALYQVIVQPQLIVKKWIQNVARISSQYWVSFWFQTKLLKCPIHYEPKPYSRYLDIGGSFCLSFVFIFLIFGFHLFPCAVLDKWKKKNRCTLYNISHGPRLF